MTLDDIIHDLSVKRVDFVKIDVEGAELEVLQGLSDTMKKLQPSIVVEIWEKDRSRVEEVRTFANQLNYSLERISHDYYLIFPVK